MGPFGLRKVFSCQNLKIEEKILVFPNFLKPSVSCIMPKKLTMALYARNTLCFCWNWKEALRYDEKDKVGTLLSSLTFANKNWFILRIELTYLLLSGSENLLFYGNAHRKLPVCCS